MSAEKWQPTMKFTHEQVNALRWAVELANGGGGGYSPEERVEYTGELLALLGIAEGNMAP